MAIGIQDNSYWDINDDVFETFVRAFLEDFKGPYQGKFEFSVKVEGNQLIEATLLDFMGRDVELDLDKTEAYLIERLTEEALKSEEAFA